MATNQSGGPLEVDPDEVLVAAAGRDVYLAEMASRLRSAGWTVEGPRDVEVAPEDTARIHVMRGTLGWGNRKVDLEAYGPGGRWHGEGIYAPFGDLLGDALSRAGAREGATLLVVAVDRFGDTSILDQLEGVIADVI